MSEGKGKIIELGREEEERDESDTGGGGVQEGSLNVGFWNVARVKGKVGGFCVRIKEWDVVGLVETWLEWKEWEKIKSRVLEELDWRVQGARKKGTAIKGVMMGIRKGLEGEKE